MRHTSILILAAVAAWLTTPSVVAQSRGGAIRPANFERNPIARWAIAQDSQPSMPSGVQSSVPSGVQRASFDVVPETLYLEPPSIANGGGCADCNSTAPCEACEMPYAGRRWSRWNAGFALTFVQPRYGDNLALSTVQNGTTSASVTETNFDYDLELSPRLWLEWGPAESLGWRVQWWQLDQAANAVLAEAPADGLGVVEPVEFPDIDISVSLPGETLRADSQVKLYAIDLEGTRRVDFDCWSLMAAGGLRYASIEQEYLAISTNANGVRSGAIRQSRSLDGIGPTFLLEVRRPVTPRMSVFSNARASLLFGEQETTLVAGEDLDLASSFTTTRSAQNDDLLPILEGQLGIDWHRPITRCHDFFFSAAVEGQWWSGVGTASNGDADLGLFGFAIGLGLRY